LTSILILCNLLVAFWPKGKPVPPKIKTSFAKLFEITGTREKEAKVFGKSFFESKGVQHCHWLVKRLKRQASVL
jgi:hypothetical protein